MQVCSDAADKYRFGFNGQEKDNEIAGLGNHNTALFWQYDTRTGRRWNLDPKPNVSVSLYSPFGLNPVKNSDVLGDTISTNLFTPRNWFSRFVKGDNFTIIANSHVKRQTNDGVFTIYGHGNYNVLVAPPEKEGEPVIRITTAGQFNKYMSKHSPEWKGAMGRNEEITLILYSCNVGNGNNSLAAQISKKFSNVKVIAADGYVRYGSDADGKYMEVGNKRVLDRNHEDQTGTVESENLKGHFYEFKNGKQNKALKPEQIRVSENQ